MTPHLSEEVVNLINFILSHSIINTRIVNHMLYVISWWAVSVYVTLSSDRLSRWMGLYVSPTSLNLTEGGSRVWPETSLEPPAARER